MTTKIELASDSATPLAAVVGELTTPQRVALDLLIIGETAVKAATAAGVTRMTVFRWLREDAEFQAAYNAWHADVMATAHARMLALSEAAITTITAAVKAGDVKAALAVAKGMKLMHIPDPGTTDPAMIRRGQSIARRKAEMALMIDAESNGLPGGA